MKTPHLIYTKNKLLNECFCTVKIVFDKHISPHKEKLIVLFFIVSLFLLGAFLTRSWPFRNNVTRVIGTGNDPPTSLTQYKSDGTTSISTGGTTGETTVVLSMNMTDPDNPAHLKPQVEVQPIGTSFKDKATNSGSTSNYAGSAITGTVTVSSLSDGTSYHWQARVCNGPTTCSSWVAFGGNTESEADFQIQVSASNNAPNTPSSLGASDKVSGTTISNATPTLEFTLTDPDASDLVNYQIQIDDSSDFSSPIVDYTATLQTQGGRTFVVGQSASGGHYNVGTQGQTLTNGSYYWRVKATDSQSAQSSYATANSGAVAFILDTSSGGGTATFSLTSPSNNSYISTDRPTYTFNTSSDDGSGISQFKINVSNTSSQDNFSISPIAPAGSSNVVSSKYSINYQGFYDGNTNNNNISSFTTSSSQWSSTQNDGKIKEGKRNWQVSMVKSDNSSSSHTNTVYVDLTKPVIAVSGVTYSTSSILVSGTLTDSKNGSLSDQSDYIRSDPKQVVIAINQGATTITQATVDLQTSCNYSDTTSTSLGCSFSQTFNQTFSPGTYTISITGTDKADNTGTYQQTLAIIGSSPTTQVTASPSPITTPLPSPSLAPTVITNIKISNIGLTSALITWDTNNPATSKVNYGLSPQFEHSVYDTALVTSHSMQLKDLQPNTDIYFEVISEGNTTVYDAFRIFHTKKELAELPPVQAVSEVQNQLQANPTIKKAAETTTTVVQVGAGTAALGSFLNLLFGAGGLTSVGLGQGIVNLVSSLLLSLGIVRRQKKKTFGVVFNSQTGEGVPGVRLLFHSPSGNLRSAVTNRNGRYTITLVPDTYTVNVMKADFRLSQDSTKSAFAYLYANLYHPSQGVVVSNEPFANLAIAIEPTAIANSFRHQWQMATSRITNLFYKHFYLFIFLGLLLSGFAAFIKPSLINIASFVFLLLGMLTRILAAFNKTRNFGIVVDNKGKTLAQVYIDLYRWNGKVWDIYTRQTTDPQGRYILSPEDGNYTMRLLSAANQILVEKQFVVNNAYPAIKEKFIISPIVRTTNPNPGIKI